MAAIFSHRQRQFGFPVAAARADLRTRVPAVLRKPTTTILTIGTKSGGSSALEKWHSQGISSRSRPNQQVERLVLRTYSCVPRVGIQGATNVVSCSPTESYRGPPASLRKWVTSGPPRRTTFVLEFVPGHCPFHEFIEHRNSESGVAVSWTPNHALVD